MGPKYFSLVYILYRDRVLDLFILHYVYLEIVNSINVFITTKFHYSKTKGSPIEFLKKLPSNCVLFRFLNDTDINLLPTLFIFKLLEPQSRY